MRSATSIGTILIAMSLATACDDSPALNLAQQSEVSACGGFAAESTLRSAADYCDAEVLYWQYDAATETLGLNNERILLNCCGEHSMTIVEDDGVYVVTERDAPEFGDARCGCMCVFDFNVAAEGIPSGIIPLVVVRDVTDQGEPVTILEETIDLSEASGSFIIDPVPTDWCGDGPAT